MIINNADMVHILAPDQILYCQADNCYTKIISVNNPVYILSKTLKCVEKEMNDFGFIRVNQSYLVNRLYIKNINRRKKLIQLLANELIPYTISTKKLVALLLT